MTRTDEAVRALTDMIRSGRYGEGDKLPPEAMLAAQIGLSRGSLREAVRQLSFAGVLRVRQGDGSYVSSLQPALLLAPLSLALDLTGPSTLLELYAVRRMLEPDATALAVPHLVAADIARLDGLVGEMASSTDAERFFAADAEFHDTLVAATGNETLRVLLAALRSEAARALIGRARAEVGATEQTVSEHRTILHAIRAKDPDLARAAATMHLAEGERWLRQAIGHVPDLDRSA